MSENNYDEIIKESDELRDKIESPYNQLTVEECEQLKREMSAHYKTDMTIQDAAQALIKNVEEALDSLEVQKDNPNIDYEACHEALITNLAFYSNIANSYDKDVQKAPTFKEMTDNIDKQKEELEVHSHKLSNLIEKFENKVDKTVDRANDSINSAKNFMYQKGANVLKDVKSRIESIKDKAEESKNKILGKWNEFRTGVKDAVDTAIDKNVELYNKAREEVSQKAEDLQTSAKKIIDATKSYTSERFEDVKNAYNDARVKADIQHDYMAERVSSTAENARTRIKAIADNVTSFVKGVGSKIMGQAVNIYGNHLSNQIKSLKQVQAVYTNELSMIESSIDSLRAAQLQVENVISRLNDEMNHRIEEIQLEGPTDMAKQIAQVSNEFDEIISSRQANLKELKQQLNMESKTQARTQSKLDKTEDMINEKQDELDSLEMA